jgi:dTDP-glucose 4,6-dehydratase
MKIVYVTGCLGFIGSYVTRLCLERGWYVKGVDLCTYAANLDLLEEFSSYENFSFLQSDINDLEFLYDCDYVINTAAETHVGNSIVKSEAFLHSNINGVENILNTIRHSRTESDKMPVFFHFSTDEVYGDINSGNHKEEDTLKPSNPYSATKACADMLILAWARTYNIPYIILRPTNNYGEGQYIEKLIPKCCKYVQLGRKLPLHNNGLSIRTWLHVKDTARSVMSIIDSGVTNEIFNVSSHFELKNIEVCNKITDIYFPDLKEKNHFYDFSYQRPGEDIRYSLDDSKLRLLGWKEQAVFKDEIVKIASYYKNKFIW